jgi:electron transport complex protein RnfG
MKTWKEYFAPVTVLVSICIVVTLALAFTYQITKPVIAAIAKANADAARADVLPSGEGGYLPADCTLRDGVLDVYAAENGSGYVVTAQDKGFGGEITLMVGIGSDGSIQGIKVLAHGETPGLGTKAMTKSYLAQYIGQKRITNIEEANAAKVDAVSGATISSNAIYRGVEKALLQFSDLGGAADE